MKPQFGDWLRGIYASEDNPQRDGIYVETIIRKGRMNPGTYYRLTDGKGNFWEYEAKDTIPTPPSYEGIHWLNPNPKLLIKTDEP